jgi:hypothetical protein
MAPSRQPCPRHPPSLTLHHGDFYGPFSEVAEAPATTGASNDDNKGSIFGYLAIDDYANKGSIVGP